MNENVMLLVPDESFTHVVRAVSRADRYSGVTHIRRVVPRHFSCHDTHVFGAAAAVLEAPPTARASLGKQIEEAAPMLDPGVSVVSVASF